MRVGTRPGSFVVELEGAGEFENLAVFGEVPGAGAGGVGYEGVGAHGEAAYGFGVGDVMADEVVEDQTGEAAAFGVEGGGAAVDVVIGLLAAGEGEVTQLEGVSGDEIKQGGLVVCGHGSVRLSLWRGVPPPYCLGVDSFESATYEGSIAAKSS